MTVKKLFKVLVNDNLYEVEIIDLQARPVLAVVNGTPIEVWPESKETEAQPAATPTAGEVESVGDIQVLAVKAPMPGTIISVAVKEGAEVAYGQEICVLEAMKMKNSIRSPRLGTISKVLVSTGQLVKHDETLVEYQR